MYLYHNYISNSHQQKLPRTKRGDSQKRLNTSKKTRGFAWNWKLHSLPNRLGPFLSDFLLRWWFELTNEAGFIRGTLGTGRRVGFSIARKLRDLKLRKKPDVTKNQTVTISNIFPAEKIAVLFWCWISTISCASTIPNKAIYFFLPLGLALGLASCFGKSLRRNMMAFRSIPVLP